MKEKEKIVLEANAHFIVMQIFLLFGMKTEAAEELITAHVLAIEAEAKALIEKIQDMIMELIIPWQAETLLQHRYFFTKDTRFNSDLFADVADGFKELNGTYGSSGDRGLYYFNKELAEKLEKEWNTLANAFLEQEQKNRTTEAHPT